MASLSALGPSSSFARRPSSIPDALEDVLSAVGLLSPPRSIELGLFEATSTSSTGVFLPPSTSSSNSTLLRLSPSFALPPPPPPSVLSTSSDPLFLAPSPSIISPPNEFLLLLTSSPPCASTIEFLLLSRTESSVTPPPSRHKMLIVRARTGLTLSANSRLLRRSLAPTTSLISVRDGSWFSRPDEAEEEALEGAPLGRCEDVEEEEEEEVVDVRRERKGSGAGGSARGPGESVRRREVAVLDARDLEKREIPRGGEVKEEWERDRGDG